ncbi:hypothetical protein ElyMa_000768000 [Elysia marginata]|uniref:Uncharacterized protein n=1 Tax=Elysia marginata TaxID=1093978 RepID=A0AAV4GRA4_9GAST|nr:hypothetical protein ElyMa_000768000 [Elysia marginata]
MSSVPAAYPAHAVEQGAPVDEKTIEDHLSVQSIIRAYQSYGRLCPHQMAGWNVFTNRDYRLCAQCDIKNVLRQGTKLS